MSNNTETKTENKKKEMFWPDNQKNQSVENIKNSMRKGKTIEEMKTLM